MGVTFYSRIGGEAAVTTAVDALCRAVLGGARLTGYFAGIDVGRLKEHMGALPGQALGGPVRYPGRDLHAAHLGLGISAGHCALVGAYLIGVPTALQADDEVLAAVRGVLASAEADVLGAPPG